MKEHKIAQLDKVLYKCSAAMHFKGKPMTGPIIIKSKFFFFTEHIISEMPRFLMIKCTWGVQVVRYPNFFLGNGSR